MNKFFSKSTLKRYLKEMRYSYKRLRFIPAKEPDKELYETKRSLIQKYDLLSQRSKIDLYFFDESGFSIKSNIPYAWSPIKETMVIKSFHAKRFNVLGFINKQGNLKSYLKEKSIKSDTVIEVFDDFSKQLTKPTVVVLDNASFHKSAKFKENIAKWANRGITLLYLPPYSPELNIIEILWKFIKYHWMEMSAYQSYANMKEYVQRMLDEYGSKRIIDFSLFEKKFYPLVKQS
jgi:transposase